MNENSAQKHDNNDDKNFHGKFIGSDFDLHYFEIEDEPDEGDEEIHHGITTKLQQNKPKSDSSIIEEIYITNDKIDELDLNVDNPRKVQNGLIFLDELNKRLKKMPQTTPKPAQPSTINTNRERINSIQIEPKPQSKFNKEPPLQSNSNFNKVRSEDLIEKNQIKSNSNSNVFRNNSQEKKYKNPSEIVNVQTTLIKKNSSERKIKPNSVYYIPTITRDESLKILEKIAEDGAFLVRDKLNTPKQPYSMSVYLGGTVYNLEIRQNESGEYALGKPKIDDMFFSSVDDLVNYFVNNALAIQGKGYIQLKINQKVNDFDNIYWDCN